MKVNGVQCYFVYGQKVEMQFKIYYFVMHKRKSNLGSEQHGSEQMQMIHDNSIWYVVLPHTQKCGLCQVHTWSAKYSSRDKASGRKRN